MATLIIPGPSNAYPDQTVKVPLNGVTYTIRWLWNERGGAWFFDLADTQGPILSGVRVVVNVDLLNNTADPRKPLGAMIPVAPDGAELDPRRDDFGQRVQVVFVDEADISEG